MNQKKKAVIEYCRIYKGWTPKDLAKVLCISERTIYKRLDNPDTLTLSEIRVIRKDVPLSKEQLDDLTL